MKKKEIEYGNRGNALRTRSMADWIDLRIDLLIIYQCRAYKKYFPIRWKSLTVFEIIYSPFCVII